MVLKLNALAQKLLCGVALATLFLGCPASQRDSHPVTPLGKPLLGLNPVDSVETLQARLPSAELDSCTELFGANPPHDESPLSLSDSPQIEIWEAEERAHADRQSGEFAADLSSVKHALELKQAVLKSLCSEPTQVVDAAHLGGVNRKSLLTLPGNVKAIFKPGSDSTEVAAYALDQLLHFRVVPITLTRTLHGESGIIQIFMKGTQGGTVDLWNKSKPEHSGRKTLTPEELFPFLQSHRKLHAIKLFDEIILNVDRHSGNYLVDKKSNRAIAIDHGQAFFSVQETQSAHWQATWNHRSESRDSLLAYLEQEPEVKAELRAIPDWAVQAVLRPHLSDEKIQGVLERIHFVQSILAPEATPTTP